jgi:hypothetical protein
MRGRLAATIRPEDVRVRMPADWDGVDQVPAALAEVLARQDAVPADPVPAGRAPADPAPSDPAPRPAMTSSV